MDNHAADLGSPDEKKNASFDAEGHYSDRSPASHKSDNSSDSSSGSSSKLRVLGQLVVSLLLGFLFGVAFEKTRGRPFSSTCVRFYVCVMLLFYV